MPISLKAAARPLGQIYVNDTEVTGVTESCFIKSSCVCITLELMHYLNICSSLLGWVFFERTKVSDIFYENC